MSKKGKVFGLMSKRVFNFVFLDGGYSQKTVTKAWARQVGSRWDDRDNGVVDSSGNIIYVTGSTYGGLDGNTNAGNADIFLVKFITTSVGTISDKVTKSDGIAVIEEALVKILQSGVVKYNTTSDSTGNYSITVAGGSYNVCVSATGYQSFTHTNRYYNCCWSNNIHDISGTLIKELKAGKKWKTLLRHFVMNQNSIFYENYCILQAFIRANG